MYPLQCRAWNVVQLSPATLFLLYLQAFLVGIVVPDSEVMPGWAKKRGFEGTYAELCKNKVCICSTDFIFCCSIMCAQYCV